MNEIDIVCRATQVIDYISRFVRQTLKSVTDVDNFCQRPIANHRHFLQQSVSQALPVELIHALSGAECIFGQEDDFRIRDAFYHIVPELCDQRLRGHTIAD